MPKRYPGWAESGARLGLDVQVKFSNVPSSKAEFLAGPLTETYQLQVTSPPCTFVSLEGQQTAEFTTGGWCIQRPKNNIRNAQGDEVKPEGLLKFWLDCPTGAKRQDVEILPGTRIFFTTGVWDDPQSVQEQEALYGQSLKELEALVEKTIENKEKTKEQNIFQQFGTFADMFTDSRQYDNLKKQCEQLGQQLPPIGSPSAPNGCLVAPNGSLVIKGKNGLLADEYLILGTFSVTAVTKI
jgi:hypothetical protein